MPKSLSEEKARIIIEAMNRGMSRGHISGVCGISQRAITRINSNLKKHGSPRKPPSGLKLGRPVKLNKAQADAMIVWMAKENHTFFVKDLVAYLRDEYRYKGCDGTIRRCLMRAGYRRKLPWQRSQKTVWVPPDYKPTFVTSSARQSKPVTGQQQAPIPEDAVELWESDGGEDEEHHDAIDIDPALQQSHQQTARSGQDDGSQQPVPPPNPYQHNGQQMSHMQTYQPQQQQRSSDVSTSTYSQPTQGRSSHQAMPPQPHQRVQGKNASRPSNKTPAAQPQRSISKPSQSQPTAPEANKPGEAFAALRQQLAERDAVIASLQQQLRAQQQQQEHQDQHIQYSRQQHDEAAEPSHQAQAQSQRQYHDMRHNPGAFDAYHITPDVPPAKPRQQPNAAGSHPQPLQHSNYVSAGGHWSAS